MATRPLFNKPQALVPHYGVIRGGLLDGWSFTFERLVLVRGKVFLDLRCAEPGWPFPGKVVRFGRADYTRLTNPGERAAAHEMQKLIDAATVAGKTK